MSHKQEHNNIIGQFLIFLPDEPITMLDMPSYLVHLLSSLLYSMALLYLSSPSSSLIPQDVPVCCPQDSPRLTLSDLLLKLANRVVTSSLILVQVDWGAVS